MRIASRIVVLGEDDVDTDQIIPARFLTTTRRSGLAAGLFADRRSHPAFALAAASPSAGAILVAGERFGCGSSREHAVWALAEAGFRAVVAPSFGDIFRQNATKNALLPVTLPRAAWQTLAIRGPLGPEIEIDLERGDVALPDGSRHPFPFDPFVRTCLLEGVDELGWLLSHREAIEAWEARRR